MTNLKRLFVLGAALFLALGPIGGGTASAQDGEIVGIRIQHPNYPCDPKASICNSVPFTRLKVVHVLGAAEGVTVNSETVRLAPGTYWFGRVGDAPLYSRDPIIREMSAVTGEDSTGTTLKMMGGVYNSEWGTLVVVDGTGATSDDVKLGTVGRRVDFYCCNGSSVEYTIHKRFIRRLSD